MTEYTPTTEQVRTAYSIDSEAEWRDPLTNHTRIHEREFDRWLAAHDAEVARNAAANALREAAADVDMSRPSGPLTHRTWLRDRADRTEREATNHKPNPELGSSEGSDRA